MFNLRSLLLFCLFLVEKEVGSAEIADPEVDCLTIAEDVSYQSGLLFGNDAVEGFVRGEIVELVDNNGTEFEDGMIVFLYAL